MSRWDYEATKAASRMWTPGHDHEPTFGYVVCGYHNDTQYSPVFATRGEANRWLHDKYETTKRRVKQEMVTLDYPETLQIVRVITNRLQREDDK